MANELATTKSGSNKFMLTSTQFGYPIYAAHVEGKPDVEITDLRHEAAEFDAALNDAQKMAKAISRACGYPFQAVPA